jgi:hypothetical protein
MFETISILALAGVAGVVTAAHFQPDICRLQRSARIKATPDTIYPLINNLHAFNSWNPFARKDPKMTSSYEGPAEGPGAIQNFRGSRSGEGSIEIIGNRPASEVTMQLNMVRPMRAQNLVTFTLTPAGGTTEVTWTMEGKTPFAAKILHLLFSMEKMVGKEFEAGLANLKSIAEQTA